MKRIGIGGIAIESCTFSPMRTQRADFHEVLRGPEMLVRYPFLAAGDGVGDADTRWIPLLHARALPGGVVCGDVYEELKRELLDLLAAAVPLEGFYPDIHGAMAVAGMDDPEADLAAAIRALVGPDCLISVSSDLHGNVTPEFVGAVDMITTYRTAPHEDELETRERARRLLLHCLEQGIRSLRAWIGYAWADTPRSMASCVVTGTSAAAIRSEAERLPQRYWDAREQFRLRKHNRRESPQPGEAERCAQVLPMDGGVMPAEFRRDRGSRRGAAGAAVRRRDPALSML
jgi:microcystin degradation protein MlrC